MRLLKDLWEALLHLAFPHLCEGCGNDLPDIAHPLCLHCLSLLPETSFHLHEQNPVSHLFTGRVPVQYATAGFFFTKGAMMQQLLHQVKYKNNKALGIYLGRSLGSMLASSPHFQSVDLIIPLPLFKAKERRRGFNQSAILCKGIHEMFHKPVIESIVKRISDTESQTHKNRMERWENMDGQFELIDPEPIRDKHVLLVDDVLTTGATLEACARALLKGTNVKLSIAVLCVAS
ncbi:MAG: ComF family protein [Flavisolibacter sp.]